MSLVKPTEIEKVLPEVRESDIKVPVRSEAMD